MANFETEAGTAKRKRHHPKQTGGNRIPDRISDREIFLIQNAFRVARLRDQRHSQNGPVRVIVQNGQPVLEETTKKE